MGVGQKITISEAIGWLKTLNQRHKELVNLRDTNANKEDRYYGSKETPIVKTPVYEVKKLDALITRVAKEIRLVDSAIKKANAATVLADYTMDDEVLGTVE